MKFNQIKFLVLLILAAFLIRLLSLNFPAFTADEARIAYRGDTLATEGLDELGRSFPVIFNSSADYQLPVVSYLTSVGTRLFGKTDFGVRIPFILLGTILVLLVYKIAQFFDPRKEFWLLTAIIAAFLPSLIFLSKTPNESIVLTFLFVLLFYLLTKKTTDIKLIFLTITLLFLTSKFAWFITAPFVLFTLIFFSNNLPKKTKLMISALCISLSFFTFIVFLQVPQSKRSLGENNFSIFNEATIKNGIDRLRGQGVEFGGPSYLERAFFNKIHYFSIGLLNWLSQLAPSVFFGQFDQRNINGFVNTGALQKVLLIPFVIGLISVIKGDGRKKILLLFFPFLITFPFMFTVSTFNLKPLLITLPFVSLIVCSGFFSLNRLLKIIVIFLLFFEIAINFVNLDMQIKVAGDSRPFWIKEVILDGLSKSLNQQVAFSDDLADDLAPFIQWYMEGKTEGEYAQITFPYKFRQTKVGNIKIISSNDTFYECGPQATTYIIASKKDLAKIGGWLDREAIKRIYLNDRGEEVAYLLEPIICIH